MPLPHDSPAYRDLSEWVVRSILDAIRRGEIGSGERLIERDIAARLAVSRAPVRDAIKRLEKLGVVERDQPRGVRVRTWTQRDAAEIFLLFDALILMSVYLAVGRLDQEDIGRLEQILADTRRNTEQQNPDLDAQFALNVRFHMAIAQASRHRRLIELMEGLILPMELWPHSFDAHKYPAFQLRQHERLFEVLKSGDRDAALACALENVREGEEEKLRELIDAQAADAEPARPARPFADLSTKPRGTTTEAALAAAAAQLLAAGEER